MFFNGLSQQSVQQVRPSKMGVSCHKEGIPASRTLEDSGIARLWHRRKSLSGHLLSALSSLSKHTGL